MALTIVVETGSGESNSNSYASAANGDSYHDGHLYAGDWTTASASTKAASLVMATRLLDDFINYEGIKENKDNALEWPRVGAEDRSGFLIPSDTIPNELRDATAEFARFLIASDRTADPDTLGFSKMKAGSLAIEIDKHDRVNIVPKVVAAMLFPFGKVALKGISIKAVRV